MNKSKLESLISPLSIKDFHESFENGEPIFISGNEEKISKLFPFPYLMEIESIINSWPVEISAHLPDARDEISSIDTDAKNALKLFKNGMGLLFNDANRFNSTLHEWCHGLTKELGLSKLTYARSLIYLTPDKEGTATHFDQNINIVVQIKGTKSWKIAPNESVINPMVRHTLGHEIDPELIGHQSAPMPNQMPANAMTVDLTPGSILVVPRGCWHSTTATGDSIALNFTFGAPTWADLYLNSLRARLVSVPQWRETVMGLNDYEKQLTNEKKLDYLIQTMGADLININASEVLEENEGP